MGKGIKAIGCDRKDIVVTTKIFRASMAKPNDAMMSRKHIIEGTRASLKRLDLDYVDVIFSHRPDYYTPLEETCRAFDWVIRKGYAFYWGTSEWPSSLIQEAIGLCERLNLHKPVVEQCEYNCLSREKMEKEYENIFIKEGMGTTIWSPLASGVLSGKYNDGNIPEGSRFNTMDPNTSNMVWNKYMSP
jgi:aryl-alcohol dehydrogenase-like predicted oxidoreductase